MYNEKRHKSNKICGFMVVIGLGMLGSAAKNYRSFFKS